MTIKYNRRTMPYKALLTFILIVEMHYFGLFTLPQGLEFIVYTNKSKWIGGVAVIVALLCLKNHKSTLKPYMGFLRKYLAIVTVSIILISLYAVIARFARVFGADKKHDTKAMSQFMDKAVLGEDIILKSKGQQRYSYCYIADAVSGLFKLLLDGQDGEAYNISDDDEGLTLGEYAEYIASLANLKVRYEIENNESVSKATYALLDTRKIKNIGWEPQYSVKDGLKRTYTIKKETLGSM